MYEGILIRVAPLVPKAVDSSLRVRVRLTADYIRRWKMAILKDERGYEP